MTKSTQFQQKITIKYGFIKVRDQLASTLRVSHVGNQDKYLGLPAVMQRSKRDTFNYIKDEGLVWMPFSEKIFFNFFLKRSFTKVK
ncbi:uncharacterized protein DS421_5g146280 [Arachis hypogaea]|nr:uncharacterized protein DS421_5g146280 [Arachis hypogaea]